MDLLMVRDLSTGRFVYTERLEWRSGETSWEYVRRSVRREAHIRTRFDGDATEVMVGWDVDSVEEFLRANPEVGDSYGGRGCESRPHDHRRHLRGNSRAAERAKNAEEDRNELSSAAPESNGKNH